jgi:hypothetical protein
MRDFMKTALIIICLPFGILGILLEMIGRGLADACEWIMSR